MFGKYFPEKRRRKIKIIFFVFLILLIGASLIFGIYAAGVAKEAKKRFAAKKWDLPARIYGRSLELYPGLALDPAELEEELLFLRYKNVGFVKNPGTYSHMGKRFILFRRAFKFPDRDEPRMKIRIAIKNKLVTSIEDADTGASLPIFRLDPPLIGSFYPTHNQDRLWVRFKDLSPLFIRTIISVEDRNFYKHHGIEPLAILRAFAANIKAGKTVQGGSTLTQQLVKNLFLTHEKTLKRKIDEAIMAISLELAYGKDKIFEAYINEVYLGQDGKRAIHGFGMGSLFYFGQSLENLEPKEIALIVGLLKGPSYFDPRRFPKRAIKRRNTILRIMAEQKLIRPEEAKEAMQSNLGILKKAPSGATRFPAFLDLVKRRLLSEYMEKDLETEGLRIFTTLEPLIQTAVEKAVESRLKVLESWRRLPEKSLETAVIITSTVANEVVALLGSRMPKIEGFNRALDMQRSIGSLIKPFLYLTALKFPEKYSLITPLDDSKLAIRISKNETWRPKNFDRKFHGMVPLYKALVYSYNVATIRLGLELGVQKLFETIKELGVEKKIPPYPSVFLGAVPMSPLEVAKMYQTLAAGGFYSPIRAITGVYKMDGTPLKRYPITVRKAIDPGAAYLINKVLQAVVIEGTGRSLRHIMGKDMGVAGKTGTTDDLRDSWFAGFTGRHLGVVWIGRDDNKSCGLTGSSGALQLWGDIFNRIKSSPLRLAKPEDVKWALVDPLKGVRVTRSCKNAISIPFIAGYEPEKRINCAPKARPPGNKPGGKTGETNIIPSIIDWFRELF